MQSLPPSWRDGIIIVDNGSADQAAEMAALRPLGTRVVLREVNGGFAVGMNTGLRAAAAAGFTHAVMVNSDARPTAGALRAIHALTRANALVGVAQVEGLESREHTSRYVTAAVGDSFTPRELTCDGCEVGHHQVDVVSGGGRDGRPQGAGVAGLDRRGLLPLQGAAASGGPTEQPAPADVRGGSW